MLLTNMHQERFPLQETVAKLSEKEKGTALTAEVDLNLEQQRLHAALLTISAYLSCEIIPRSK